MELMDVHKGYLILKQQDKEVLVPGRDIYYGWNRIRPHQYIRESFPHFIIKAIIGKLIMNKKDGMITEHEYPDGKQIDVLQVKTKGKELIGYQVETQKNFEEKDFPHSVVTICLFKHPEAQKHFDALKRIFKDYVV